MIRKYLFKILLFFCLPFVSIQFVLSESPDKKYYLKSLDISEGLSQNTVNCILQDSKGFVWFGTKDGLNRYDGYSFKVFNKETGNQNSIGNSYITTLNEDERDRLWIGTMDGLYLYDMKLEKFRKFDATTQQGVSISYPVNTITLGNDNLIWISTEGQGVFCYDEKKQQLDNFIAFDNVSKISTVRNLKIDKKGNIWFSFGTNGLHYSTDQFQTIQSFDLLTGGNAYAEEIISDMVFNEGLLYVLSNKSGFSRLDISNHEKTLLNHNQLQEKPFLRKIIQTATDEFWIGSETGIYIYNELAGLTSHLIHLESDPYSLSDNAIHSLFKDRDEGIWIGSYFGGINYYPKQYSNFEKYYPTTDNNLQGKRIREFCEDNSGNIWIGSEDAGLYLFDPVNKSIERVNETKLYSNIHGLCADGDNLWIGTYSQGLFQMNIDSKKMRNFLNEKNGINEKNIYTIHKDDSDNIWIGGGSSLHKYNPLTNSFERYSKFNGKHIRDIQEDKSGNLYVATAIDGLFIYYKETDQWENFVHDEEDMNSLPINNILSVFADSKNTIWITTQGEGFCRFHPETGSFRQYTTYDGLPNNVVYQILEDDNGYLWLSTNDGLSQFDVANVTFTNYSVLDGLPSRQFNYSSSLKTKGGDFFFGTINGFITFNPTTLIKKNNIYPIILTDFYLFNKRVSPSDSHSPLSKSITYSDEIILSHNQNSFSIQFAILGYDNTDIGKYYYKLEGADRNWINCTAGTHLVNYSNVNHGNYTFHIKLFDDANQSSELPSLSLKIHIRPPLWLSKGAILLYFILAVFIIYVIYIQIKARDQKKRRRQNEIFKQHTEREMYKMKIDFFIDIAHEIRTPLTLIKSPFEHIMKNESFSEETQEDLDVIEKNTNRLIELTNQLLDFQKIEAQSFHLHFKVFNVCQLISETIVRFKSVVKQSNLAFNIELPENGFYAPLDQESFKKIISNLLDNAVKNAESYITVSLYPDYSIHGEAYFDITVENDGNIIPPELSVKIFEPFVQNNNNGTIKRGTGLGLAMSRSLAQLHHGYLSLDNEELCNRFRLSLPVKKDFEIDELAAEEMKMDCEKLVTEPQKNKNPKLLIVDDDREFSSYISRFLSKKFNIVSASDGQRAFDLLEKKYFDLVILDVMMPNMDGYTLCEKIKSNIGTSHIPVILLTAKTGMQSQIKGIDCGADAFIEKPFSNDFLIASINNLLANKAKMVEALKQFPVLSLNSLHLSKTDEDLFKRVDEVIQKNINNPDFSLNDFADALNMSHSSLYRKIKGTFDISPNEYIRTRRIRKAAELLSHDNLRVNEVCYLVGFNSPSYFTKCFIKEFNVHPKDYHALLKQKQ